MGNLCWVTIGGSLAMIACGSVDSVSDANSDVMTDADAHVCDPTKPFADVRQLGGVNSSDDEGSPTFSADELTIYYFSNRQSPGTPDFDAYVATRATRDESFGLPAPVAAVNTSMDERGGSLAADGLSLFFYSLRLNGYDLYVSSRTNIAASFGAPTSLSTLNTNDYDQDPFITADSQFLYFTRTPSTGVSAIYRASTGPTGFGNVVAVTELNSGNATSPVLSADGMIIYFSSDRLGSAGSLAWISRVGRQPNGLEGDARR